MSDQEQHYAACNDCSLSEWADSKEEAKQMADRHAEETGHDAYHDVTDQMQY